MLCVASSNHKRYFHILFTGLVAVLARLASGAVDADEIKTLPGWDQPLPSRMWSGFLDSNTAGTQHSNYWFAESEGDPKNDPVVLWQNGGPGAASFFGYFIELGPFQLSDASVRTADFNKTGVPTLFRNDFSWSTQANLLIVNSPPPVGFSYCDGPGAGPSGGGTSCGTWNDTRVADTNLLFLQNFFKAFPEFAANDFYITGESYAGVYVPMLAEKILEDQHSGINLKGFAVGDACAGTDVLCGPNRGPWFDIIFMYGHGQVSTKLYEQIRATCKDEELKYGIKDPACQKIVDHMNQQIGGYFAYNLYDECWGENDLDSPPPLSLTERDWYGPKQWKSQQFSSFGEATKGYPCGGNAALGIWVNQSAVRTALHIPQDAYFFSGDNGAGFVYDLTEKNLMPFYRRVVKESGLRVLVYNGDTDPGINSFVAQNWTEALGFEETQEWRPWTMDGKEKVAGYVTRYDGDFDFLTIRGSGHMVPEFKPAAALEFITTWLNGEDYKHYNPPPASSGRQPAQPLP